MTKNSSQDSGKKPSVSADDVKNRLTKNVPSKVDELNAMPKKFKAGEGVVFYPDFTDSHATVSTEKSMKPLDLLRNHSAKAIAKHETEECNIDDLLLNPYNREIQKDKVESIKRDIRNSGIVRPLVYAEIDHNGKPAKMVVDGHHRYHALKEMGYKKVPIVLQDERGIETKAPKEKI